MVNNESKTLQHGGFFYDIFIYYMKLIITESQLKTVVSNYNEVRTPGSPNLKKNSKEKIVKLAMATIEGSKYSSYKEFREKDPYNFSFIISHGPNRGSDIFNELFPERKRKRDWTPQMVADLAKDCKTSTEFKVKHQGAYNKAIAFNMLDKLFPRKSPTQKRYTDDEWKDKMEGYIELAKNFKGTRGEFGRKHANAYKLFRQYNLLDKYLPLEDITDELLQDASWYTSIKDLRSKNLSLYNMLYKRNLLDVAFPEG